MVASGDKSVTPSGDDGSAADLSGGFCCSDGTDVDVGDLAAVTPTPKKRDGEGSAGGRPKKKSKPKSEFFFVSPVRNETVFYCEHHRPAVAKTHQRPVAAGAEAPGHSVFLSRPFLTSVAPTHLD